MIHRGVMIFRLLRRHSHVWNLLRNLGHLFRRRHVSPGAWLIVDGSITIGRDASISSGCRITVPADARLTLGARTWLARGVEVDVLNGIHIGDRASVQRNGSLIGDVTIGRSCVIAPNFFASSGRHYFDLWPELPIKVQDQRVATDSRLARAHSRPVVIEDDCWIGVNVVLAPGVRIGRGSVIGANSVVTHDVAPYSVAAGNPARVLRGRLGYQPKRELDGSKVGDLPYFHSGFVPDGELPPVADGPFVVVMDCMDAKSFAITVRSLSSEAITLGHQGELRRVEAGVPVEFNFPLEAVARTTGQISMSLTAGGRLQVLKARTISGAIG